MADNFDIALFVDLNHTYGRSILEGVAAFARTRRRWGIEPIPAKIAGSEQILLDSHATGIVIAMVTPELAELAKRIGKPVVNISGRMDRSPCPRVTMNNRKVGQIAARHLMEMGVESYAYLPSKEFPGHNFLLRRLASVETLNKNGFPCCVYGEGWWKNGSLCEEQPSMDVATWLKALPFQTGLMTDSDDTACKVVTLCRNIGVDVPNNLLVMGVDRDELQSVAAGMFLTSVDVNGSTIGYEAAKLMERILGGEKVAPDTEILIDPVGVRVGASTDFVACGDEHIATVLSFIRDHANRPIQVNELADLVPLSRRSLEIRFQKIVGRSPNAEIRRIRTERIKDLLAYTELPISTVAIDMGYGEVKNLSTSFRKETGMTPTEFRLRFQPLNRAAVISSRR